MIVFNRQALVKKKPEFIQRSDSTVYRFAILFFPLKRSNEPDPNLELSKSVGGSGCKLGTQISLIIECRDCEDRTAAKAGNLVTV
jgi:hypothetical protein